MTLPALKNGLACLVVAASGCAIGPMRIPRNSQPGGEDSPPPSSGEAVALAADHLDVRFARDDVVLIVRQPDGNEGFPDLITFRGRGSPERGLVLETTPGAVLVRLPRVADSAGRPAPTPAGGAIEGTVRRKGRPVANCEVRLIGLARTTSLWVFESLQSSGSEQRVVTNERGRFRFDGVQTGPYRIALRPHGWDSWLVRLREVPVDAVVGDETVDVGVIDLHKRILE